MCSGVSGAPRPLATLDRRPREVSAGPDTGKFPRAAGTAHPAVDPASRRALGALGRKVQKKLQAAGRGARSAPSVAGRKGVVPAAFGRTPTPGKGSLRSWLSERGGGAAVCSGARRGPPISGRTWSNRGPRRCSESSPGEAHPAPLQTPPSGCRAPGKGCTSPPGRLLGPGSVEPSFQKGNNFPRNVIWPHDGLGTTELDQWRWSGGRRD